MELFGEAMKTALYNAMDERFEIRDQILFTMMDEHVKKSIEKHLNQIKSDNAKFKELLFAEIKDILSEASKRFESLSGMVAASEVPVNETPSRPRRRSREAPQEQPVSQSSGKTPQEQPVSQSSGKTPQEQPAPQSSRLGQDNADNDNKSTKNGETPNDGKKREKQEENHEHDTEKVTVNPPVDYHDVLKLVFILAVTKIAKNNTQNCKARDLYLRVHKDQQAESAKNEKEKHKNCVLYLDKAYLGGKSLEEFWNSTMKSFTLSDLNKFIAERLNKQINDWPAIKQKLGGQLKYWSTIQSNSLQDHKTQAIAETVEYLKLKIDKRKNKNN